MESLSEKSLGNQTEVFLTFQPEVFLERNQHRTRKLNDIPVDISFPGTTSWPLALVAYREVPASALPLGGIPVLTLEYSSLILGLEELLSSDKTLLLPKVTVGWLIETGWFRELCFDFVFTSPFMEPLLDRVDPA